MGLLDKLQSIGSIFSKGNGQTPTSTALTETQLNPAQSSFDLDGETPEKYSDRLPE
tara:strand:- start:107 stop:274 length:168 start_codon:yes stop_codon:yes gene_type:complete